jgi:hypothetical protein
MLAEVEMSELFLPESVTLSSRNFYLIMIKSSIDFIMYDGEKLWNEYSQVSKDEVKEIQVDNLDDAPVLK